MPTSSSRDPRASTIRMMSRAAGAERHADADLLPLLRHRARHHAVDADDREHQAENRKRAEQHQVETRGCVLVAPSAALERLNVRDRLVPIDRVDLVHDRTGERRGIGLRADDEDVRRRPQP